MVFSSTHARSSSPIAGKRWVGVVMLVVLVGLGVTYLVQVNSTAARGYEITDLQQQLKALKVQNQDLQAQVGSMQSFQNMQQDVAASGFVAVQRVEYLSATGPAVGVAVK